MPARGEMEAFLEGPLGQSAGAPADMQFNLGKRAPRLIKSSKQLVPASHSLALRGASSTQSHSRKACFSGISPSTAGAFASVSLGPVTGGSQGAGAKVPLFMIASANESKKKGQDKKGQAQAPAPAPVEASAWRVFLGNLAAGAVSGCAVEAALYPIDTIKTRLQAMIGGGGVRALLEAGGGKGLYAGVWGNLAGVAPASAVFISVYEPVKKAVCDAVSEDQQYLGAVAAGMAAGAASSLIRVPTEVVKQRLQTKEFGTAIAAIRSILAREGVRGLYAGYGAFMLRDLPFDAIEFLAYEQLKKALTVYRGRELQPQETSVIGAVAGGFTGIVTTPLDVLKTRLMVQGSQGRYANVVDATIKILREEGAVAFMKGWQPRLLWISMGGFVFFPVLEAAKKAFNPSPLTVGAAPSGH